MPGNYTPVPANLIGKKLIDPIVADGDTVDAASVNPSPETLADAVEYLIEGFHAMGASNWIKRTGIAAVTGLAASGAAIPDNVQTGVSANDPAAFVGCNTGGAMQYSMDGVNWTAGTVGSGSATMQAAAWAPSLKIWATVGNGGAFTWSTDGGKTWANQSTVGSGNPNLYAIAWSPTLSQFVAVGAGGAIFTSTTGTGWSVQTSGVSAALTSVAWGNGAWSVCVNANAASGQMLSSVNGTAWTARTLDATARNAVSVVYGTKFVAFEGTGRMYTSPDAVTWTFQATLTMNGNAYTTFGITLPLLDQPIGWNGRQYVIAAASPVGINAVFSSIDGNTWTGRPNGDFATADISGGNSLLVAGHPAAGMFAIGSLATTAIYTSVRQPLTS